MAVSDWVTDRIYMAGRVKRYSCWPTIHQQTVGEHVWQVACIYEQIFGDIPQDTAKYIRHHDSAEVAVGDPPFPSKANNPDLKAAYDKAEIEANNRLGITLPELDPVEKARVKVCDLLEMTQFGMVERQMGNKLAIPVIHRTMHAAIDIAYGKLNKEDVAKVNTYIEASITAHGVFMKGEFKA